MLPEIMPYITPSRSSDYRPKLIFFCNIGIIHPESASWTSPIVAKKELHVSQNIDYFCVPDLRDRTGVFIYIYIYIHACVYIHICIWGQCGGFPK